MRSTFRHKLLTSTIMIGALSMAAPALAQADAEAGEDIVVTGSRIARTDLTSTSPVTVVGEEEFVLSGAVNVEQVINNLPQVVPTATAFSNNPGGGVATLNLRGLGAQRNLVLVNGRRYVFFDAAQTVDLNTIPQFLVESVDLVTGGASAVYGSDALAGVTNFRLRTDINGVLAGAQYNITGEGDGPRYNAYLALGSDLADGRGNITVFGEYYKRGSVYQGARSFSRQALGDGDGELVPLGSASVPQGRFVAAERLAIGQGSNCNLTTGPRVGCYDIAAGTNYPGGGAFFGTPGTSTPYSPANSYNYAPVNYLMVPQERWSIGGYGEYEVADGITAYAEVFYINNRVENELAASPITQAVDYNLATTCGLVSAADCAQLTTIATRQQAAIAAAAAAGAANPYGAFNAGSGQFGALQPGFVRLTTNTRTTGIASRNASDDRNAFRALAGVRGDLTDSLTYDAYYMYARTRNAQVQEGNISRSAFVRLASNGTCNVFGEGLLTQECQDGLGILAQNQDISELQVAQASISGPIFQPGWTNSPIAFAAGVEWRSTYARFIPDTALSSGDVVGFNAGDPTEGGYNVKEVFGEIVVPLVTNGFINSFELNGAFRYSDYSLNDVGGVWTYSGGATLKPVSDVMFRGQYQRAVRAPNVGELFGGQGIGFPAATDYCALPSAATNTTIRDLCIATGVPASNVGQSFLQPNAQIEGVFGGNPNLREEVGDTWTAGVVLSPSFVPRLNIAVDWYSIKIQNAVAAAGGGVGGVLDLCYNIVQDASSPICGLISRDPQGIISGPPYVVTATNVNLAEFNAEGIDFQADYSLPLNFGLMGENRSKLGFSFYGGYTIKNNFIPTVGVDIVNECEGRFGLICGNPTPTWKWQSRVTWMDGPVTSSVRWRHVGKVRDDDDSSDYIVENFGSHSLFDLAFSITPAEQVTFNFGVNNIFNKMPKIAGDNAEQANTYPNVYDVLGRDFFVSAQFRF